MRNVVIHYQHHDKLKFVWWENVTHLSSDGIFLHVNFSPIIPDIDTQGIDLVEVKNIREIIQYERE
jgi:hypothetical protein